MKTVALYHSADFDGLFCREIARKFLPEATLIGWDYGQPVDDIKNGINQEDIVYMMDISIPELMDHPNLIWIDHHKTAIDKYPSTIPGYRIDGVAACRLAWQWFMNNGGDYTQLPIRQLFIDRMVNEPWAVRLAGEYDIWDKRDPNAELFQHGLRSQDLTPEDWATLLEWPEEHSGKLVVRLLNQGRAVQYAKTKENESIVKQFAFTIQFEGFCLLACNAARYNSQLFAAGLKPEHDGCLGFNWDGQAKCWRVSLYTDKPGVDLSPVAIKYGGGGHRGACGFRTNKLPFLPA